MLFLLFVGVLMYLRQPTILKDAFHSLYSKLDRTYSDTSSDLLTKLLLFIFSSGTLAMCIYILFFRTGHFSFLSYLMIEVCIALAQVIRTMMTLLLGYVFMLRRKMDSPRSYYTGLWVITSSALYITALIMINVYWPIFCGIILGLLFINHFAIILWKLYRVFGSDLMSLFYILLYTITLEVLPLLAIALGVKALA